MTNIKQRELSLVGGVLESALCSGEWNYKKGLRIKDVRVYPDWCIMCNDRPVYIQDSYIQELYHKNELAQDLKHTYMGMYEHIMIDYDTTGETTIITSRLHLGEAWAWCRGIQSACDRAGNTDIFTIAPVIDPEEEYNDIKAYASPHVGDGIALGRVKVVF